MITSLPVTPGCSFPFRTTCTVRGICHQNSPVAQIAAASVRTTGVPTAPRAPYMLEWESEATTNDPGTTYPCSTMIWWPMPLPAGKKSTPCSLANASILRYLPRFSSEVFWMSWSRANTGWRGSARLGAPIALNLEITAEVLSWVITWRGRIERKSPARRGLSGPSARCACATFSTTVWPIATSLRSRREARGRDMSRLTHASRLLPRALRSVISSLTEPRLSRFHTASLTLALAAAERTGPARASNFSSISRSESGLRGSPLG